MGLIVNKPMQDLRMSMLLEQLGIETAPGLRDAPVVFGGPVETARGFVLHSDDYIGEDATLSVAEGVGMTASQDVLRALARGQGPQDFIMALGYAGWGAGQLESEIVQNGWLTCDTSHELLFEAPPSAKWEAALATLGVNPLALSAESGRA